MHHFGKLRASLLTFLDRKFLLRSQALKGFVSARKECLGSTDHVLIKSKIKRRGKNVRPKDKKSHSMYIEGNVGIDEQ